jgi:hypothetical protein
MAGLLMILSSFPILNPGVTGTGMDAMVREL